MTDSQPTPPLARPTRFGLYGLLLLCVWTAAVAGSLTWNLSRHHGEHLAIVREVALNTLKKEMLYRRWNAMHGGVYAPVTPATPPDPLLTDEMAPEREITPPSGRRLTLINPAYMTRQVHELARQEGQYTTRITSLKPIRPATRPLAWEAKALRRFAKGDEQYSELITMNGQQHLHFMLPLKAAPECTGCHAAQGYEVGDIVGGISISVPTSSYLAAIGSTDRRLWFGHLILWALGTLALGLTLLGLRRQQAARLKVEEHLRKREAHFRTLYERAPVGYQALTEDGIIIEVNQGWLGMLGYRRDEVVGRSFREFLSSEEAAWFADNLAACRQTGSLNDVELQLGRKDGSELTVSFNCKAIAGEGDTLRQMQCTFQDISERKKAGKLLEQLRRQQKRILEAAGEGIYGVDCRGITTFVNPAAARMLGWQPDELIGRPHHDIVHHTKPDGAPYPSEQCPIYAAFKEGRICQGCDEFFWRKDGSSFPVEYTSTPIFEDGRIEGAVVVFADISSRRRAEIALQDSETRFRWLFDNMSSGVVIYRPADEEGSDFLFVDINAAAERIDKIRRDGVTGRSVREIFPGVETFGLFEVLQRVWRTGRAEHHPAALYKDDRLMGWRENHVFKLPSGEIVAVYDDITERKRVEEELRQAQKMEAIGTLAGGIAHDFNNILTAILGYTQLALQNTSREETNHSLLTEVVNASQRAASLVNQILTFSRQSEQERKPLLLQPVIKEALKLLRGSLPATIDIRQQIDPQCGQIHADPVQIHQVLMNLCTNAYHAMRDRGGTLEVRLDEVTIAGLAGGVDVDLAAGTYARLTVRDTGCGMDRATTERIFEPYFTTKEAGQGTGLGLATVHGIVRSHDGAITVDSEPGHGTTFTVYFPLAPQQSVSETESQKVTALPAIRGRILFVDDETTIVRLGKMILERLGGEVVALSSSVETLELFSTDPARFDLVITDQTMPELTGFELARRLLAIRPDLPIILCTGYSEMIDEAKAKEIGIREFIMKPLVIADIAAIVQRVLNAAPPGC